MKWIALTAFFLVFGALTAGSEYEVRRGHISYTNKIRTDTSSPGGLYRTELYFGFNAEEVENANSNTSFGSTHADPPQHLREKFTEFYSRIFDLWWPQRHTVSVREFLDISHVFAAKKTDQDYYRKPMESEALGIVTIHRNGDITPFSPEFSGAKDPQFNNFIVGNVRWLESMEEIQQNPVFQKMHRLIHKGQHNCADSCPYFDFCGSAFVSNRYFETGRLDGTESTTCIFQRQIVSEVLLQKLRGMSVRKQVEEMEVA